MRTFSLQTFRAIILGASLILAAGAASIFSGIMFAGCGDDEEAVTDGGTDGATDGAKDILGNESTPQVDAVVTEVPADSLTD